MRSLPPVRSVVFLALGVLAACATSGADGDGDGNWPRPRRNTDPQTVAGDYLQGRFAVSQQAYDRASDSFARAAGETRDRALLDQAFRAALAAGHFDRAVAFAGAIDERPDFEEAGSRAAPVRSFLEDDLPRLTLVADRFRQGDEAAARALLDHRFGSTLAKAMAHLLEGWTLVADDKDEAAARFLADVPEGTFAGFAPLHVAIILDNAGRIVAAEEAYTEALAAPGADVAFRAFASFVEREQSRAEAVAFLREITEDGSFLRRIGRMGLARLGEPLPGETREFRRMARRASDRIVVTPRDGAALVFLNFAWTSYRQAISQKEAAEEAGFGDLAINLEVPLHLAQLAAAIDEDLDAAHYVVGSIASEDGHFGRAEAALAEIPASSWLYNFAAIDRAEALVALDRTDEAIALLETYTRQDALAPEVLLTLADLQAREDRTREAVRIATTAIETAARLASDDSYDEIMWRYYFVRGAIQSEANDWAAAEPDLVRALELAPDQPTVLNFLGYSYVERGENLDAAFDMIERALAARPASGAITDSLGWAYYQRGEYEKAIELLERAVELSPGDDVITDHLGDAYWQAGRRVEARFEWRRVLEIDELDPDLRATVEAKLAGEAPAPGSLADMRASP